MINSDRRVIHSDRGVSFDGPGVANGTVPAPVPRAGRTGTGAERVMGESSMLLPFVGATPASPDLL